MLDAQTGSPAASTLTGTLDETNIFSHLQAIDRAPERLFVQMHTHPATSPHSDTDWLVFADNRGISAMVIVALDGTWYVLSLLPESQISRNRQGAEPIYATWWDEYERLEPKYHRLVDAGTCDSEQAQRLLLQEIWELIGPRFGVRYDRVEPGEGKE